MEIIKYLAFVLSNNIEISQTATIGLIKLAIKDQLGPYFPLNQVTYDNLKMTIQDSLKKRLIKLKVQKTDSLIDLLVSELTNNQSLITLSEI
ncbi:MAG: hypothetical protein ACFFBP_04795 [Promethearchaeota archaeon]